LPHAQSLSGEQEHPTATNFARPSLRLVAVRMLLFSAPACLPACYPA